MNVPESTSAADDSSLIFRLQAAQRAFCVVAGLVAAAIGGLVLASGLAGLAWPGALGPVACGALLLSSSVRLLVVLGSRLVLTAQGVEITRWRRHAFGWDEIAAVQPGTRWASTLCVNFVLADRIESAWVPVHDWSMPDDDFKRKLAQIQEWHARH